MNKKVKATKVQNLLFFDIETSSKFKKLDVKSKEYELFAWSKRDKITCELPPQKQVLEDYDREAALSPVFNKIVCITVGYVKDNVLNIKTFSGEQRDIIRKFYDVLNKGTLVPCGYNIISFDMPVIRIKALEEDVKVDIPDGLIDSGKKPWNLSDSMLDLMEIVKGSYYYSLSLDSACYLAKVESPKEGNIKGSDVSKAFYGGRIKEIIEYCERDVVSCVRLFLKLSESDYKINDIVVHTEEVVISEDLPLIESINKKKQIDPEDFDKLIELSKGMELKDKQHLVTILKACLLSKDKKKLDLDEEHVMVEILNSNL